MSIESLVGFTLAGYTLRAKVGEGGTSTVYRAEHAEHETVAVKVLREKLRHDKTAVQRFLREAQFGQRVVHPNIVRTIDFGQAENERYYLAIDWAAGELLEKYAEKHGPLPATDVALIITQLCAAVQAAHDAGIVHRDLKPENVMYDPESRHVMLLDFGIAADTDASPDQRLTRAGFFVGTLMYVAPEALSGELVGPAADQYSLATIAYFLFSGALPYIGKTPRELFSQLLTQPPTPLSNAKPGLRFPASIEAVVMRALSKAPKDRFPDVTAFAQALAEAVSNPGPLAPESTAMPSTPAPRPVPASAASAPSSSSDDDKSGGLFGKMKGIVPPRMTGTVELEVARDQLLSLLAQRSAKRGDFVLASGRRSTLYVDCRLTTMSPEGQRLLGVLGLAELRAAGWDADAVGGLTLGADPIAYAMAHASAFAHELTAAPMIRAFTVRKQAKAHGTGRRVEGPFVAGDRVVVVEDVITTGGSALTAVEAIRQEGGIVLGVLAVVDRQEGGREAIEDAGLTVRSLALASQLVARLPG